MRELEKLDRLPPYVFTEVNRIKDSARAKGKDIIDFVWVILIYQRQSI